ncbi:MAG: hypothetical protein WCH44_15545, partial [Betaproteobacteria bacterium]
QIESAPGQPACCLLLAFNPDADDQRFTLPPGRWTLALDSSASLAPDLRCCDELGMPSNSLVVLRRDPH